MTTTGPGALARALASRYCSATTMRRIVDPAVADLQAEVDEAARSGDRWRARAAWLTGQLALWRALMWHGACDATALVAEPSADRRLLAKLAGLAGSLAVASAVAFAVAASVIIAKWRPLPVTPASAVLLAAHMIPLVLPIAVALAILWVRVRDGVSRRRAATSSLALGAALTSLAFVGWILPAATRATSRSTETIGRAAAPTATLDQQRERARVDEIMGNASARITALNDNLRWALAAAPLALAVFAIALASNRRRIWRTALGSVASVAYLLVLIVSLQLGVIRVLPVPVAVWAPNVLFVLAGMAVMTTLRHGDLRKATWI